MDHSLIINLKAARDVRLLGNKARGLRWLAKHHLNIPDTLALSFMGSQRVAADEEEFDPEIAQELADWIDSDKSYAVRSSANLEDGQQSSFAGQFITLTNVQGLDSIQTGIRDVIGSGKSEALASYYEKMGETASRLEMGVLVQEMVTPVLAGVVFSKNPTTGLDEIIIEAVEGLGEALVQDGVTPDRWIFRWGQFSARPEGKESYNKIIREIALESKRIARLYGEPVDLEWAWDGTQLYWLQVRPITILGKIPIYSNRIAREVLPGIIKPLISSINIPLVNRAWIQLFEQLLGPTDLKPEELTSIFHYRAYFNMGVIGDIFEILGFPRESLEMLLGLPVKSERPKPSFRTLRHIPRVLRAVLQAWNYHYRSRGNLAELESAAEEFQKRSISDLTEKELIGRISELTYLNTQIAYFNIILPLLMSLFNAILKQRLEGAGIDFTRFDVTSELDELKLYDPNTFLDEMKSEILTFPADLQQELKDLNFDQLESDPRYKEIAVRALRFIERFGHLSESGTDFSSTPWREDRDAILKMVMDHNIKDRGHEKVTWDSANLKPLTRWRLKPYYQRARKLRLLRERVSSVYTSSYGWFRVLFNALAEHMTARGLLSQPDDIYYLTWNEIREYIDPIRELPDPAAIIQQRRSEIEVSRDLILPDTIYGDSPPPLTSTVEDSQKRSGIPTSPGYYQGRLKVIRSTTDFDTVQQGDVIAIPHSDVAWTPLFAKAGAVIAEAGGILSHSSIVAREYGIPCVVSVSGATRLPQDCSVYVDGYQGEVSILGDTSSEA